MRHPISETARAVDAMALHMQIVQGLRQAPHTRHSPAVDHHMAIVRELARQVGREDGRTPNAGIERRAVGAEQGVAGGRVRSNDLLGGSNLRSE